MKKEYQKPELEMVSLISTEAIATGDEEMDGEIGMSDSIF